MTSRRYLPALVVLFIGSGCAALIYEIVWFQLLQLVIGSSSISLGILLGTFMGGMCLGSVLMPGAVSPRQHPLRVYASLEAGIGVLGLLILFGMPLVGGLYTAWAGDGMVSVFVRAIVAGICLLPPTMLMGATLPAISRWVKATPEGVSWLGFFYGGNIAGGVVGSLVAGFYLLRVHDVNIATFTAVAINAAVASIAYLVSAKAAYDEVARPFQGREGGAESPAPPRHASVYVTIALSGLTALGAEVVWTRLLSLHFGATVYTFSLILAVFLVGLGVGSTVASLVARDQASARRALGWCQLLLCGAAAWAAYMLTESLTYWPINPSISTSPWYTFQLDLVRCLWVVLPGAILWGASFPLALAAVASSEQDAARLAGGVYAANTVGAIAGSLIASFILIPWIGSSHTQQVIIITCALSSLLMLEPAYSSAVASSSSWNLAGTVVLALAMVSAGLLARSVHQLPGLLVAYGRYAATRVGQADVIYVGEGLNATVAVSELSNGVRNYHNAGKVQASSEPQDMRLQRMLGHMTTLLPRQAKKVLVIGCGAGVTAGAVSVDPSVEHETIAEIEPLVPRVVSTYFSQHNIGPARPLGEGRGDALYAGVLRVGEEPSQSGRRDDAVRSAVREQHRRGEERDRHVPRRVSKRRRVGQYERGQRLRSGAVRPRGVGVDRRRRAQRAAEAAGVRAGSPIAARNRHDVGDRSVLHVCGTQERSVRVAARRANQSRQEPAPAVPRRARAQSVSG